MKKTFLLIFGFAIALAIIFSCKKDNTTPVSEPQPITTPLVNTYKTLTITVEYSRPEVQGIPNTNIKHGIRYVDSLRFYSYITWANPPLSGKLTFFKPADTNQTIELQIYAIVDFETTNIPDAEAELKSPTSWTVSINNKQVDVGVNKPKAFKIFKVKDL